MTATRSSTFDVGRGRHGKYHDSRGERRGARAVGWEASIFRAVVTSPLGRLGRVSTCKYAPPGRDSFRFSCPTICMYGGTPPAPSCFVMGALSALYPPKVPESRISNHVRPAHSAASPTRSVRGKQSLSNAPLIVENGGDLADPNSSPWIEEIRDISIFYSNMSRLTQELKRLLTLHMHTHSHS